MTGCRYDHHQHAGVVNRRIIRPRVPIIKILASAATIGSGGSGGREGPIAQKDTLNVLSYG